MVLRLFEREFLLGIGHDSLSNKVHELVVNRTPLESLAGGQTVVFSLEKVTSHEDLSEKLQVSASGSLGNAITGGGSLSAQFLNQTKVQRYSVYLLVSVRVLNAHQKMVGLRLTQDAWDLMATRGPEEFRTKYGDEVAIGVTTGGRYFALFELETRNEADRQAIDVSISAQGTIGSWSAKGEFHNSIEKAKGMAKIHVYAIQEGGNTIQHDNPDAIVAQALQFPDQVRAQAQAVPYLVEMLDYKSLPLPPAKNPIDIQNQQEILRRLAQRRSTLLDLLTSLEYVIDHQTEFIFTPELTVVSVKAQIDTVKKALDTIYQAASACFNDYRECKFSVEDSPPTILLPKRIAGEPSPSTIPTSILRSGSQGPEVKRLQEILKAKGFDPGPIDGKFGPRTLNAVRQFQTAKGLSADGVVGPLTWKALVT